IFCFTYFASIRLYHSSLFYSRSPPIPFSLFRSCKGGVWGEKGDLRQTVVVAGSRLRQVLQLEYTCLLLAGTADLMAVELAPLNLSGGSPPVHRRRQVEGFLVATTVSFNLCNVLQLCIIPTSCTPADSSQIRWMGVLPTGVCEFTS
uniref:Uncharacterized protein n=1 Tax=Aegilops tauschii subsp. strangulata TaxID=200361 RepID=A0A453NXY2_AEGTS